MMDAREKRVQDPHKWADRVDDEIASKNILPFFGFLLALASMCGAWFIWNDVQRVSHRLDTLEKTVQNAHVETIPTENLKREFED